MRYDAVYGVSKKQLRTTVSFVLTSKSTEPTILSRWRYVDAY